MNPAYQLSSTPDGAVNDPPVGLTDELATLTREVLRTLRRTEPLSLFRYWDDLLTILARHLPGVHGATLCIRDAEGFTIYALYGYPEALRNLHLPAFTERAWYGGADAAWQSGQSRLFSGDLLRRHLHTTEQAFGPQEHYQALRRLGRLDALHSNLLIPLVLDGTVQAHLNLDSHDRDLLVLPDSAMVLVTCLLEATFPHLCPRTTVNENQALRVIAQLGEILRPIQDPQELLRTGLKFTAAGFQASAAFMASDTHLYPLTGGPARLYQGALTATHACWADLSLQDATLLIQPFEDQRLILAWEDRRDSPPLAKTALLGVIDRAHHAASRAREGQQLRAARDHALEMIGMVLEVRDLETQGHTQRVTRFARQLAQHLRLTASESAALHLGALLHDIGKIALPDQVLLKPGHLEEQDWNWIRRHPDLGHELALRLPYLPTGALDVIRHHHERWDGTGYPHRLQGHAIPYLARLFSVIDTYDALTSARPYKAAWTSVEALQELQAQASRQFDPATVQAFLTFIRLSYDEDAGSPKRETTCIG